MIIAGANHGDEKIKSSYFPSFSWQNSAVVMYKADSKLCSPFQ